MLVRDRVRTKMERDILVDVRHPFIVHLEYGEFSVGVGDILPLLFKYVGPSHNLVPCLGLLMPFSFWWMKGCSCPNTGFECL